MSDSDKWTLATGEDEGRTLIYRIRVEAPAFAGKAAFRRLLVVLWPYESPNQARLPTQNDVEQMTDLENLLRSAFEAPQQGFLAVVITGDGLREWQWYIRDPEVPTEFVDKTLTELAPLNVRFNFADDHDWSVYKRFLEIAKGGQK